jgi:hypothetical protein
MITITPAALADLGELGVLYHPKVFKALVVQLSRSPALTLRDAATGKIMAICGLYPQPGHGEAWLHMAPGLAGTPAAVATLRALIGIVRSLPPQIRVTALVQDGNRKGERIAGILGMAAAGKTAIAGFEMTVFQAGGNP